MNKFKMTWWSHFTEKQKWQPHGGVGWRWKVKESPKGFVINSKWIALKQCFSTLTDKTLYSWPPIYTHHWRWSCHTRRWPVHQDQLGVQCVHYEDRRIERPRLIYLSFYNTGLYKEMLVVTHKIKKYIQYKWKNK